MLWGKYIYTLNNNLQLINCYSHYFLAQGGANTHENSQYLKDVDTRLTFEPTQMIKKTNVEVSITLTDEIN